jgi:hypothetical protein
MAFFLTFHERSASFSSETDMGGPTSRLLTRDSRLNLVKPNPPRLSTFPRLIDLEVGEEGRCLLL